MLGTASAHPVVSDLMYYTTKTRSSDIFLQFDIKNNYGSKERNRFNNKTLNSL